MFAVLFSFADEQNKMWYNVHRVDIIPRFVRGERSEPTFAHKYASAPQALHDRLRSWYNMTNWRRLFEPGGNGIIWIMK